MRYSNIREDSFVLIKKLQEANTLSYRIIYEEETCKSLLTDLLITHF